MATRTCATSAEPGRGRLSRLRPRPQLLAQHEAQSAPGVVDGADLGVDPAGRQQLGPEHAYRLARELLERQTDKVIQAGGVIVEYGDAGLVALWNAPVRQHDHATLAGGAALACLAELPELGSRWQAQLGAPLSVTFGLHTGTAQVGSIGSLQHFKYGATGPAVRLAGQVRRVAQKLRLPLVLTGPTCELVPESFAIRRLGRVRRQ